MNFDFTTKTLDVPAHHVHANTTPRKIGDGCRRGKSGHENQIKNFSLRELGILSDQSTFDRLGENLRSIETFAVVLNPNQNPPALVRSAESNGTK